ncbi:MAG: alpha/beta fold hydrolase [Bacteroidetes bacterium]|nr:alpha/beta fold hydrolase [Bacteroidota bacterium]
MTLKKNLVLMEKDKKPIVYDVYYTQSLSPKPVVVFCHGYKGFKDWGAWHLVAEAFSNEGFFFIKFNFSHNGGTVEQPIDFPDLDAFSQNNFSKELEDLDRIIKSITSKQFEQEVDRSNISLIGHSRGGGIVLIKAEENPIIKNVITWAGVSDFKARFQVNTSEFRKWKEIRISYVENTRTKQQMPLDFQFFEDFKANEERYTIQRVVENLSIPQLIIHGSIDPAVAVEEAKNIHRWNPNSILKIIENSDHVFGSSHPWKQNKLPEDLQKVVEKSIEFLKAQNP